MRVALASKNRVRGAAEVNRLLERATLEELPLAARLIEESPLGQARQGFDHVLMRRWTSLDPEGAMTFARSSGTPQQQENRVTQALWAWAAEDPRAALAFWEELPAGTQKDNSLQAIH